MRIGWSVPLPGPFYLSGTLWRSRRPAKPWWYGQLSDGWRCHHRHRTREAAVECSGAEERRRRRDPAYAAMREAQAEARVRVRRRNAWILGWITGIIPAWYILWWSALLLWTVIRITFRKPVPAWHTWKAPL